MSANFKRIWVLAIPGGPLSASWSTLAMVRYGPGRELEAKECSLHNYSAAADRRGNPEFVDSSMQVERWLWDSLGDLKVSSGFRRSRKSC